VNRRPPRLAQAHWTILSCSHAASKEFFAPAGASDVANEILFCGYRFDAETSLYHVRHRMYHPTLGRWLQPDPLGYVDGMSLYAYCGSGPLGMMDPMGLAFTDPRKQMQNYANQYESEMKDAQRERRQAAKHDRDADRLERQAKEAEKREDFKEKRNLRARAQKLRGLAEEARGRAAQHEEFMKEIGQQAQDLLDDMNWQGGFGGGRNRGVGGGGDDDTAWWDKTWYEGNILADSADTSVVGAAFSYLGRGEAWAPGLATDADALATVFSLGIAHDACDDWKADAWSGHAAEGTWAHTGSEISANVGATAAGMAVGFKVSGVNPSFKVAIHGPHHNFPLVGKVPHLQGMMWQPGVSQSHHILPRIPLAPWWP